MAVQFFQREIWAKEIQDSLELEEVLVSHCTKKYEGECEYAKTVRILGVGDPKVDGYTGTVEYEDMDDVKQNLDIDIQEYFSFKVDDVDKAQSMPGLSGAYQKKAVKRLSTRRELYVGRLVAGKLLNTAAEKDTTATTYALTKDAAFIYGKDYYVKDANNKYVRVKTPVLANIATYYEITASTKFKQGATHVTTAAGKTQANVKTAIDTALTNQRLRNNMEGGYLEVDPVTYNLFKNNLIELSTNNPELIRKGVVGMYDNYTVTRTNAIHNDGSHYWCFAHSGEAIAFAGQINEVEALRLESTFGDGIRGLDTYGMKIIAQDELEAIKIPV
jgi:hypothetical protein